MCVCACLYIYIYIYIHAWNMVRKHILAFANNDCRSFNVQKINHICTERWQQISNRSAFWFRNWNLFFSIFKKTKVIMQMRVTWAFAHYTCSGRHFDSVFCASSSSSPSQKHDEFLTFCSDQVNIVDYVIMHAIMHYIRWKADDRFAAEDQSESVQRLGCVLYTFAVHIRQLRFLHACSRVLPSRSWANHHRVSGYLIFISCFSTVFLCRTGIQNRWKPFQDLK
jgi:hypothetical protein